MQFDKTELKKLLMYFGALLIRFCTGIFNIFPIKKNRILFYSFNGKTYGCNPRVIFESLYQNHGNAYEMIWSLRKPDAFASELPSNVKRIKFRSLKHYYYMKTARIVIYNVHEEGEVARRKGQTFIQTWHASNGYKNMKTPDRAFDKKVDQLRHKNYSYVCTGCESMTQRRIHGSMQYQGELIHGTPRMDRLFQSTQKKDHDELCKNFEIAEDAKLLLYAPTWRQERNDINYGLDYQVLREVLHERFGGNWYILVRFHPNVETSRTESFGENVINVTKFPEMQKLICASDAMISDYSSCVWDFSFTYRPCFLFLPDFEEIGGNSLLEIPIEEWGFPCCYSIEELKQQISVFDAEDYNKKIKHHHEMMGSYEDGFATERVVSLVESLIENTT